MRATKYLAGLALVVAAAVFFAGGVASAQTKSGPFCGDTVSGNVSLSQNLVCPGTGGLEVGGEFTTIHLNGHSITCPDEALPCFGDSGIISFYDNTTIVGPGTISGFGSQILFEENGANTVQNLKTNGGRECWGEGGVVLAGVVSTTVKNVSDTCDGVGFFALEGVSNTFRNDTATGDFVGFYLFFERQDTLTGDPNVATHGGIGYVLQNADHTLVNKSKADHNADSGFIDDCSTYSTYTNNTSNVNGLDPIDEADGYTFYHSDCGRVAQRILQANPKLAAPVGFSFPADHFAGLQVTFTGNLAKQNACDGAYFEKVDAAEDPVSPGGSTITGNSFLGNGHVFGCEGSDSYRTYSSQWAHNTANNNGDDGYYFYDPAADKINGNIGNGNGEDGLEIFYDDTCLVTGPFGACDPQWVNYNTFVHNFDFGAYANEEVASTGNVAHNNGTAPIDCVNVNCQSHALVAATPALAATKGAAKARPERTFNAPSQLLKLPALPSHS